LHALAGLAKRCMEIAQRYVEEREGFGMRLADRESVQIKLGEIAHAIAIGRLRSCTGLKLDQGDRARKRAVDGQGAGRRHLHQAADVAIQLNGARLFQRHHPRMDLPLRSSGAAGRWRIGMHNMVPPA
jgi:acyl-CoA dehydrogenase